MNELIKTEQIIQADWEIANEETKGYCFRVCVAKNYDYVQCDGTCYGQSEYDYINDGETMSFYHRETYEFIMRNPEVSNEAVEFYLVNEWHLGPYIAKLLTQEVFQKILIEKQPHPQPIQGT